jgi:four helix bundle protein
VTYRELIVWQKAMDFVESIYQATAVLPRDENFGLASQLRRASVSIPSNIAEGQGRETPSDFLRFLWMAHGSIREVETQVLICDRLRYFDPSLTSSLMSSASEVGRLLNGLIRSIRNSLPPD